MTRSVKLLRSYKTPDLCQDQREAFEQYFKVGRVCVDAGAGTGKTTTLIEIAAEAVLKQLENKVANPFERMLLVTFGVEASRKLVLELKNRLEDHVKDGGKLSRTVWRMLETQSNIRTIDSLIQSLLREIAIPLKMSLSIEILDGLERERLLEDIFNDLRNEKSLETAWMHLDTAYPEIFREYGPENLEDIIWNSHQKLREFCWKINEIKKKLVESLKDTYGGIGYPTSVSDLKKIVTQLRGKTAELVFDEISNDELLQLSQQSYRATENLISDFCEILTHFDEKYSKRTRVTGHFTYIDLAYLVWSFMESPDGKKWKVALSKRFDHLLVDEYQDTSFVQNEILKAFVRNDEKSKTNVLLIGDVKQSIYQWRSAEPRIFDSLIQGLSKTRPSSTPPFLGMVRRPIVTNFRSHSQLIDYFNSIFSRAFNDETRGQIAGPLSYENLRAFHQEPKTNSEPHIHIMPNPMSTTDDFTFHEAQAIRSLITGPIRNGSLEIRKKDGSFRQCQLGDITLLFRRTTYIPTYVNTLREAGIKCAVLSDVSLFREIEVSLVINILDWFANPDSKDSLLRILRSPISAFSDESIRYIVRKKLFLTTSYSNWPDSILPHGDKKRLENLIKLRNDLRWDREGPKADLIAKVIAHGFLDSVVATSQSGLQAHANLWLLMELVSAWEEEELLPYREFVERLKALRDRASEEAGREYPRAIMADEDSSDCVKIRTVHAAKGLEFPIVILPDAIVRSGSMVLNQRMIRDRIYGMVLRPRPASNILAKKECIWSKPNDKRLKWISPTEGESLLWTSTERDPQTGRLLATGRNQSALQETFAEFWRLLYVAATRAKDHFIFSIGPEFVNSRYRKPDYQWASWMPFLQETVQYPKLEPNNTITIKMPILGSKSHANVRIYLFDSAVGLTKKPKTPPNVSVGTNPITDTVLPPQYIPASLSPSSCGDLIECPRRFQYSSLWGISGIRELRLRREFNLTIGYPDAMTAERFGSLTHSLLENRSFTKLIQGDSKISQLLDPAGNSRFAATLTQNQCDELYKTVGNLEKLLIFRDIHASAKSGEKILKEYRADSILKINKLPPILVTGTIDLMVKRIDGTWLLVDYKAEPKPPQDSYQERIHKFQLEGYSWLAKESLDLEIKEAALAYLYPTPEEHRFIPNQNNFSSSITKALTTLQLDAKRGLKAKPNAGPQGQCYLCPYRAKVGGPCEYG